MGRNDDLEGSAQLLLLSSMSSECELKVHSRFPEMILCNVLGAEVESGRKCVRNSEVFWLEQLRRRTEQIQINSYEGDGVRGDDGSRDRRITE